MDLVIRGRSQDQHGVSPSDTGRTRMEPGRTGPEGVGGPEWSQAVQEQRGPKNRKQQQQQMSSSLHQREPEAQGRVAAESDHR